MSPANVEIVREAVERFNQFLNADELDLSLFASEVVLDNSNAAFDGLRLSRPRRRP
jgi:hypothetical protein